MSYFTILLDGAGKFLPLLISTNYHIYNNIYIFLHYTRITMIGRELFQNNHCCVFLYYNSYKQVLLFQYFPKGPILAGVIILVSVVHTSSFLESLTHSLNVDRSPSHLGT